jgi:anti-sigma B factor antagonist
VVTEGPPFSVQLHTQGDEITVVAFGEVDLDSAPRLGAAVEQANAADCRRVVVDLRGVDYLDSSGVHCLLDAAASARRTGHKFRVVGVQRPVFSVLAITGVIEELAVEPAVEE